MSGDSLGFIAALDVGTTTLRCQIINSQARPVGAAYAKVKLLYPQPGCVEINPDELFDDILTVIRDAVKDANIGFAEIKSLGISTQRATFITWEKDSGKHLHNFITWKDIRTRYLLQDVNSSWKISMLRWAAYFAYLVTRNPKMGIGSKLRFSSNHVSVRLLWVLLNIKEVNKALKSNNLMYGTLETWLVYKFTESQTYITDISNASATGLLDPFDLTWSIIPRVLNIPTDIFPKVVDNDYEFGVTKKELFGVPIRIGCVMADQSSSMFGSCCFDEDDLKITMGTGAFLDVNTSNRVHPSLNGMYPLVGWRIKNEIIYMSEVACSDAGSFIEWMLNAGLIHNPAQSSDLAIQAKRSDGVYFIPAFSGLGPPINNERAATGFLGIKPTTSREQMVRAVLESLTYRIVLTYNLLQKERNKTYKTIRIDGGLSRNDFICQMLADLTDLPIERPRSSEMSVVGVAFLAGMSCKMWTNKNEIYKLCTIEKVFKPTDDLNYKNKCRGELNQWLEAVKRFVSWYKSDI